MRTSLQMTTGILLLLSAGVLLAEDKPVQKEEVQPKFFETPEKAVEALFNAMASNNLEALEVIVGTSAYNAFGIEKISERSQREAEAFKSKASVKYVDDKREKASLVVEGQKDAFPMPLIKKERGWCFDNEPRILEKQAEQRRTRACQNNLRQALTSCLAYAVDHNDEMPPKPADLVDRYVTDCRVFLCPVKRKGTQTALNATKLDECDYVYLPGLTASDGEMIAYFCPAKNHGGDHNFVRVSGGIAKLDDAEFAKLMQETLETCKLSLALPAENTAELAETETKKLQLAVEQLGDNEFQKRDKARKALQAAGTSARTLLEAGAKSSDAERAQTCKELLSLLEIPAERRALIKAIREELGLDKPR